MPRVITFVGHLTMDEIVTSSFKGTFLGGPPSYGGSVASSLGSKVNIYSSVGRDFPDHYISWLNSREIDTSFVAVDKKGLTTKFKISYSGDLRKMWLLSRCKDIPLDQVDKLDPDCAYIGPVACEVNYDMLSYIKERFELVALDPQGMLRDFLDDGTVYLSKKLDDSLIKGLWLLRASLEEATMLAGEKNALKISKKLVNMGVSIAIITLGKEGSVIATRDNLHLVPAYITKVIDQTGAGDALGGGFVAEYLRTEELVWSCSVGSACASFAIETPGPYNVRSRKEIIERAEKVMEGVRKLNV